MDGGEILRAVLDKSNNNARVTAYTLEVNMWGSASPTAVASYQQEPHTHFLGMNVSPYWLLGTNTADEWNNGDVGQQTLTMQLKKLSSTQTVASEEMTFGMWGATFTRPATFNEYLYLKPGELLQASFTHTRDLAIGKIVGVAILGIEYKA